MKIIVFLKKYKIVFIVLIILSLLIYFYSSFRRDETIPIPTPPPLPLTVTETFPGAGEQDLPFNDIALIFFFSEPVDGNSLVINVSPNTSFTLNLEEENTKLVLLPDPVWEYDADYVIKISASSKKGAVLNNYEFNFTPREIKVSDLVE